MSNGDGPTTLADWVKYLHAAAQVKPSDPDYREARDAVTHALLKINALNVGSDEAEATANEQPSAAQSIATVIGQGPGLGTGEVFRGLGSAVSGEGFRKGAQEYRDAVSQAEAANPNLMAGLELAGGAALPAGQIGQGTVGAIKAGVPLTIAQGAKLLGKNALQAAIPGAVAGFSQGGEDPGDFGQRIAGAEKGAILAGALGAGGTALALPLMRSHAERFADIANKGNQRALTSSRLAESQARLEKLRAKSPQGGTVIIPSDVADRADVRQAVADYQSGALDDEGLQTAIDYARRDAPNTAGRQAGAPAAAPISEGPPGSNKPVTPQPGLRGPGGSQRWSTTQIGAPGLDLNSPAAESQLRMLQKLTPAQLKDALSNPLFASLAKALGVQ